MGDFDAKSAVKVATSAAETKTVTTATATTRWIQVGSDFTSEWEQRVGIQYELNDAFGEKRATSSETSSVTV